MLGHVLVRPEVERETHRLAVALAEQGLDVVGEADRLVRARQLHRRRLLDGGKRRGAVRRGGVADPPPARHGHVRRRVRTRLGVLEPDPRAPLQVGDEGGAPLRVGWKHGLVGRLAKQLDPASALLLAERLAHVLGDHSLVRAVALAVGLRASEDLA